MGWLRISGNVLSEPQYEAMLELPCFVQEGAYPPLTPTPLGCQGSPLVQHSFVSPSKFLAQIKLTLKCVWLLWHCVFILLFNTLAGSVEAQLKKALTIAVKKRKTNHLGPPAKFQRLTQCHDICGSCHRDISRLCKQMIQCDDCDQWYHYVCVGVRASDAEFIDFVCPGKCRGQWSWAPSSISTEPC